MTTLDEHKAQARAAFLETKAAYMRDPTEENWKAFCNAKVLCKRLGVLI